MIMFPTGTRRNQYDIFGISVSVNAVPVLHGEERRADPRFCLRQKTWGPAPLMILGVLFLPVSSVIY
jgi:hypothetical protein